MASEKDIIKAQNAAAQAQTQARNEQQALDYFNAMDNYYLRQYQDQVNKSIGDAIQLDQYRDTLQARDIDKDARIRAFDLSEERYREQLAINQAEFERAETNLNTQFDSTLRRYEDALTDQTRAFEQEEAQFGFQKAAVDRRLGVISDQYDLQGRQNALSINRAKDQLTQQGALRDALQDLRSTQLTDEFDLQSRQNALSIQRSRDALNPRSTVRDASALRQAGLLAANQSDIALEAGQIANTRIKLNQVRENQELAADLQQVRAELNRDAQLANIAFQKQGQRIETLTRVGQAQAAGRKGVSSARTLQTTLALSGLNTARLTNLAFFAQQEFEAAKTSTDLTKQSIGLQDDIRKIAETNALAGLDNDASRLTIQDTYETALRGAEAAADATALESLGTEETLLADIATNRRDTQAAFDKATYDAETAADVTALSRLDTESKLLADLALLQFDADTAEGKAQKAEIAYALGLSEDQLTMNKERLGASLSNEVLSIDDQLLALDQAKYKADYNAHAARMLPPEFAPDAKAPYDVPLPEYVEPRPGAAPAPAYQAQYVAPPTQSGLSQALAIGGAVLGVAAAPLTAGASAGLAMGLGSAATAGAVGAALGGASIGLTTLSQQQFIYQ